MPFSATETNMNGFISKSKNEDTLVPICAYSDTSIDPLSYQSPPLSGDLDLDSYFSKPDGATNWMPDELWGDLSKYTEPEESPPAHPVSPTSLQNKSTNLEKIVEYETWDFPSNLGDEKRTDQVCVQMPIPSFPQQKVYAPTPTGTHTTPIYPLSTSTSVDSDGWKAGISQPSSSPDSQSRPKKRRSLQLSAGEAHPEVRPDKEKDVQSKHKPSTKAAAPHSVIERRYRENLNSKISQLDQILSLTRRPSEGASTFDAEETHAETKGKARKADVLVEAMRYVNQAELEKEARMKEIEFMRLRVTALEKLVHCGDCALLKQFSSQHISESTRF